MSEKLFTPDEVAARWGVHKATVLRLFHSGALPGVAISRGKERTTVRFRPSAVEAWERKRESMDLRRSFATRKVAEGWDRDYVKAITGHRTDKVFARSNKPSLDALRAVVEGAPSISPSTSVVKLLSNGPGLDPSTVLSA